jgi:probable dihydroxyacetone kinase regulator
MSKAMLTKKSLAMALKELMREKSIDKITIKEITDKCYLSRKSFYYHFDDKYALINWIYYHDFVVELEGQVLESWETLENICHFFYENEHFYRNALNSETTNTFKDYFSEILNEILHKRLSTVITTHDHKDFFIELYADFLQGAITKWLMNYSKLPPDQFVRLMKEAISCMAKNIVENEQEDLPQ